MTRLHVIQGGKGRPVAPRRLVLGRFPEGWPPGMRYLAQACIEAFADHERAGNSLGVFAIIADTLGIDLNHAIHGELAYRDGRSPFDA